MLKTKRPSNSVMEWFKTNTWSKLGAIGFVAITGIAVWYVITTTGSPIKRTLYPVFMDSETGKIYHLELKVGMDTAPAISPDTGRPTLYQPESCYWNADGSAKSTPTYVILNSVLGKPGPTFCPDCGRLVIPHNPMPGGRPPPTREEYEKLYKGYFNR